MFGLSLFSNSENKHCNSVFWKQLSPNLLLVLFNSSVINSVAVKCFRRTKYVDTVDDQSILNMYSEMVNYLKFHQACNT